jgi:hypothetical protein
MMGLEMRLQDSFPVPVKLAEIADWPRLGVRVTTTTASKYGRPPLTSTVKISATSMGTRAAASKRSRRCLRLVRHPPAFSTFAAAQGNFSIALAGLGYQVTWNDLRPELVDYVRLKLPSGINVEFVVDN